jgi:hypothetical protein
VDTAPDVRQLLAHHHAFYEVSPHHVVVDQREQPSRVVHDGFDVCIYGVRTESDESFMPPPREYALSYEALRRIVEHVAESTSHACAVNVMPLPAKTVLNVHADARIAAVLLIRIARWGVHEAAGPQESRVLELLEAALHEVGLRRR